MNVLRRIVQSLVLAGTLVALFYAEENWRGARAWEACRQRLEARGEKLDLAAFAVAPIPPERNLARFPFFRRWGSFRINPKTGHALILKDYADANFGDLREDANVLLRHCRQNRHWPDNRWEPAAEDLNAFEKLRPMLSELAAAHDAMPTGEFRREEPVNNQQISSGHDPFAEFPINRALVARACAEASAGRDNDALRDLELALWMRKAIGSEPDVLLSAMLRLAMVADITSPIEFALERGGWSAAEIERFQGELREIDLLSEWRQGVRAERAWSVEAIDNSLFSVDGPRLSAVDFELTHGPRGWIALNKAAFSSWYQRQLIDPCDPASHRIYRLPKSAPFVDPAWLHPGSALSSKWTRMLGSELYLVADAQAQIDALIVRCAVCRYVLAHEGREPKTLDELVPQYLERVPNNVRDGKPLRLPDGAQPSDALQKT